MIGLKADFNLKLLFFTVFALITLLLRFVFIEVAFLLDNIPFYNKANWGV